MSLHLMRNQNKRNPISHEIGQIAMKHNPKVVNLVRINLSNNLVLKIITFIGFHKPSSKLQYIT